MSPASGLRAAVIGAGVIGVAVARALARRGAAVEVIDAQDRSREASWAAGGMLAPHSEFESPSPLYDLGRASLALYQVLRDELHEATGQDIGLRLHGTLLPILDGADAATVEAKRAFLASQGVSHRLVSAAELRREEPALSHAASGALETPDHAVDNRRLWAALAADAVRRGVTMSLGERIGRLEAAKGRIVAIHTGRRRIEADEFIIAAGAWSAGVAALAGFALPANPVKGQLIKFAVRPELLRRVVRRGHCYLVPRMGPELVAGATSEEVGFDKTLTEEGLAALSAQTLALVPSLARHPVIEHWAGLRPRLVDGLPALGRVPGLENLTIATGHHRNGILLTPITGEVIAAEVHGEPPAVDLAPFDPGRFGGCATP